MNTLIIHPKDPSTDFLRPIYQYIQHKTVIRGDIPKRELNHRIKRYQRILMMGHGSPYGLFSMGQFTDSDGYIIDDVSARRLRGKETMCIWCNADDYIYKNGLKGIFTGMFISEMDEAEQFLTVDVKQDLIDESNERFSYGIGQNISEPLYTIYQRLVEGYGELVTTNPVAKFNFQRLYYRD